MLTVFQTWLKTKLPAEKNEKDCKPNKYQIRKTGMNPGQTAIALQYLEKLGIDSPFETFEANIRAKDPLERADRELIEFCRACYSNLPCTGDANPDYGKKGVRRGGKDRTDAKCREYTRPKRDVQAKLCATYWNTDRNDKQDIYLPKTKEGEKRIVTKKSCPQWWGYVNVETRCKLTIYVKKDFKGTKEVIDRKSKYHDWLGWWWANDVRSYKCECES